MKSKRFFRKTYAFISSMKMGLLMIAIIALIAAFGSIIMPGRFFQSLGFKLLFILVILNMTLCNLKRLLRFNFSLAKSNYRQFGRELGIIILHLGIILIIAGAGLGVLFGQSTSIMLGHGQTADISKHMAVTKPWQITLDKFRIEYNEDGSASQYYSHCLIKEKKEAETEIETETEAELENAVISVNHPLKFRGVKIYQEGFRYKVKLKMNYDDHIIEGLFEEGESIKIPGTEYTIIIYRYIPNYDKKLGMYTKTLRPDNPHVMLAVYENEQPLGIGVAPLGKIAEFEELSSLFGTKVSFLFSESELYTLLRLKSDPGLPVAATGGLLLMLGILMAWLSACYTERK